jgi:uncharacterized C2H2 Zn-finger protein
MHCDGKIVLNCPLKRDHLSYQARYLMHCDGKILLNCPLKRDHLSYQARYLMHCDGKILLNCPLKRDHLSYQARYLMHCDGKILLNCPLKRDHLIYKVTFSFCKRGGLIRGWITVCTHFTNSTQSLKAQKIQSIWYIESQTYNISTSKCVTFVLILKSKNTI